MKEQHSCLVHKVLPTCLLSPCAGNNIGRDGLLVMPHWVVLVMLVEKTSTVLILRSKRSVWKGL